MLIWTTTGPKRAEKSPKRQAGEEAFAESQAAPAETADDAEAKASPDVFHETSAETHVPKADAAEDADWSGAESARTKTPETAE